MATCLVCLSLLEPTKRSKLYSAYCVLPIVREFVGQLFPGSYCEHHPRRGCWNICVLATAPLPLLEKILKTRQTLTQLETELKSVGTCLGLQSGPSSEDHASKDQRTPLYSMIDIRHCTSFIEKFLYHSRMAVHKPTTAVSQFQYVFFHDFDGGRFTVAQNGLP